MEVLIKDLNNLKLSPSLIVFLKCIHVKDNVYLEELNKVADVFTMAKHLESLHFIKIIGKELNCESFEIRKIGLITYLDKEDSKKVLESDVDEVIDYFKKITGKIRIDNKSASNRKFVKARLSEGYSTEDLKKVALFKFNQWRADPKMGEYISISTFYNDEKFQSYIGALDIVKPNDFADDI